MCVFKYFFLSICLLGQEGGFKSTLKTYHLVGNDEQIIKNVVEINEEIK